MHVNMLPALLALPLLLSACSDDGTSETSATTESSGDGDGDGDATATGDGDGDATTGDGDGDVTTGDGDGDVTTGDGDGDVTTGDGDGDPGPEQGCTQSGGTIEMAMCCPGPDFPNLCLDGACGCGPNDSESIQVCSCPDGMCFDGESCVAG